MKIEKVIPWQVRCENHPDRCDSTIADSEEQAQEWFRQKGWGKIDGKTVCPDCVRAKKERLQVCIAELEAKYGALQCEISRLHKAMDDNGANWEDRLIEKEAEIATLKAPKWHRGHPDHPEQVLLLARYDYPDDEYFLGYEVDKWSFSSGRWENHEYNRTVLGWCEIPEFALEGAE